MGPATARKAINALRRLCLHGALVVLFSIFAMQGALAAHAATHNYPATDQCSICHAAGSAATPVTAAMTIFTISYSNNVPQFPPDRQIPSFNIPSYRAARSPPMSL